MSMSLDNALWLAGILTEVVIVGLLFYRRIWRTLPVFCSYCVWDVLSNVGVYAIFRYSSASYFSASYFHIYVTETIIDSILQFCVLVELAWSVLRPLRASLTRRSLLVVIALIMVVGAIIWPFATVPGLAHATSKQGYPLRATEADDVDPENPVFPCACGREPIPIDRLARS